jgi:archaellin
MNVNGMLIKLIQSLRKIGGEEKGFATIPTIIGAVSAIAVAGTLANAVVYQGSDLSQQAEQMVQETLQNIQGTYQLKGGIIATADETGSKGTIGQLTFTLALVSGGGHVDFTPPTPSAENNGLSAPDSNNTIVISYTDKYQHVDNLFWTLEQYGKNNGDNYLEEGELFQITVGGSKAAGQNGGNLVDALDTDLSTDTVFDIEVKASQGATLRIERRTPSYIDNIIDFRY